MPWGLIISLGVLGLDYAWNHWVNPQPGPKPDREFQIPLTDAGAPYPLIFGRCRIKQPVLVWCDTPTATLNTLKGPAAYDYTLSMHLVLGIGFLNGEQHVLNMWAGDAKLYSSQFFGGGTFGATTITGLQDLVGDGNVEDALPSGRGWELGYQQDPTNIASYNVVAGAVEFLNGSSSQLLVGNTFPYNPLTRLTEHMTETVTVAGQPAISLFGSLNPQYIGSYRGALSVFLFGHFGALHWFVGTQPHVDTYSFEVSSYPAATDFSYPSGSTYRVVGNGANPADVIYDILTGKFGKLGLDPSLIDMPSFQVAAYTLWAEKHSYSRAIEDSRTGADILQEILVQIAGVLYEEPSTGQMVLKLIRNDYDPTTRPEINTSNGIELMDFQSGSWYGLPNKIRLTYLEETDDYREHSVTAQNLANAVSQDGLVHEQVLNMPGITNSALAVATAERELGVRSQPTMTCTAVVDGSFWGTRPGDVVKLTWSKPDVAGVMFRVATVDLGSLADGKIKLGLVQDSFYVWRLRVPVRTGIPGHTVDTGLGFG